MTSQPTLFDEASARLPLFDTLPEDVIERLAAAGFGRGLLTAAIRARLRKAGFLDMGMLARATPTALMAVRKIGPVRVDAIRIHVLGELARLVPGARAMHDKDTTDRRRLDRLRSMPAEWLPFGAAVLERLGPSGPTWADFALMRRVEAGRMLGIVAADLDEIVSALARVLMPSQPHIRSASASQEDDAAQDARARQERAEELRERDREWDEAAPARGGR
ncbi:MAG TPA: hypothetical protein K8W01_07760 [Methylorubrum populi]|uniref:Uncharacterized protein n=1 Tax=Methylorubrum populi TaxID=223967 RepID=A0A921JEB4_9HYPH|nr:hypothetical protein [Methylorubrum populi]